MNNYYFLFFLGGNFLSLMIEIVQSNQSKYGSGAINENSDCGGQSRSLRIADELREKYGS